MHFLQTGCQLQRKFNKDAQFSLPKGTNFKEESYCCFTNSEPWSETRVVQDSLTRTDQEIMKIDQMTPHLSEITSETSVEDACMNQWCHACV